MSVKIELEFTDGQWELIKNNYGTYDSDGERVDCTEETFIFTVKQYIGKKVTGTLATKAVEATQGAFEV